MHIISYHSFLRLIMVSTLSSSQILLHFGSSFAASYSKLLVFVVPNERLKSLLELLQGQILTLPKLQSSIDCLRWNEDVADNLDNTIGSDAIFNCDGREGIDLDVNVAAVTRYVDAKRLVFKEGLKVNLRGGISEQI